MGGNILKGKSPELLVLIASALFGFTAILTKMLMESLTSIGILMFRFLFVTVTFPIIIWAFNGKRPGDLLKIRKEELGIFFFMSFMLFGDIVLFFQSLYYIDVNKAIFLFLTYPIISLVMARVFINESFNYKEIIATVVSLIGLVIVFWNQFSISLESFKGDMMVMGAAFMWSGYVVLNRYSGDNTDYNQKTFWLFLFNSLLMLPLFLLYGNPASYGNIGFYEIIWLVLLSLVCTLVPYALLSYTSKDVKSSTSSIILLIGPIIGILLSFIILKENPPFNVIIGGLMIMLSAIVSSYIRGGDF